MLKIISKLNPSGIVKLGDICEFQIIKQDLKIETRSFIKDQNILYLKPLFDWNSEDLIRFFPETPGNYTLATEWRNPDGLSGWVEHHFEVGSAVRMTHTPQIRNIDAATRLWVPSKWEAGIMDSGKDRQFKRDISLSGFPSAHKQTGLKKPLRVLAEFFFQGFHKQGLESWGKKFFAGKFSPMNDSDKITFDLFPQLIKPGWVIYDIGANLGLYSIQFSRLAGQQGHVYCLEANPVCVYFLRANLELNEAFNCEILPAALLDGPKQAQFTINYGNSNLGIAKESIFYSSKIGQEIMVQSYGLDELIKSYNLRQPDLIKIDIEGAEEFAIKGMEQTLSRFKPVIILEVHGKNAAEKSFPLLDSADYRYQVISKKKEAFSSVKDLLKWFPDVVLQVICYPHEK